MTLLATIMSDWFSGPRFGYSAAMLLLSVLLLISAVMVTVALQRRADHHKRL